MWLQYWLHCRGVMLCYAVSMLCCVLLCCVESCHVVTSCHVMLCRVVLCYIMLWYVVPVPFVVAISNPYIPTYIQWSSAAAVLNILVWNLLCGFVHTNTECIHVAFFEFFTCYICLRSVTLEGSKHFFWTKSRD
jgi:hypothetical protein